MLVALAISVFLAIHISTQVPSKEKLSVSQVIFAGLIKKEKSAEERVKITGPFVDVRDIATLHSLALGNDNVSGERISLHSGMSTYELTRFQSHMSPQETFLHSSSVSSSSFR